MNSTVANPSSDLSKHRQKDNYQCPENANSQSVQYRLMVAASLLVGAVLASHSTLQYYAITTSGQVQELIDSTARSSNEWARFREEVRLSVANLEKALKDIDAAIERQDNANQLLPSNVEKRVENTNKRLMSKFETSISQIRQTIQGDQKLQKDSRANTTFR